MITASAELRQNAAPPSHVPAELVRNWPLAAHAPIADPYEEIIRELHRGPAAFYAADGLTNRPGGCWVFRQASGVREIHMNCGEVRWHTGGVLGVEALELEWKR